MDNVLARGPGRTHNTTDFATEALQKQIGVKHFWTQTCYHQEGSCSILHVPLHAVKPLQTPHSGQSAGALAVLSSVRQEQVT